MDLIENMSNTICLYGLNKEVEVSTRVNEEIKLRYQLAKYLIDPNRFRFRKVIRILGLALTFIKMIVR